MLSHKVLIDFCGSWINLVERKFVKFPKSLEFILSESRIRMSENGDNQANRSRRSSVTNQRTSKPTTSKALSTTSSNRRGLNPSSMVTRSQAKEMLGEYAETGSVLSRRSSRISETSFKSTYSAKQRKNILLARLKAQNEMDELKISQTKARHEFEQFQMQRKFEAEQKDFEIQRRYEEQQRIHEKQLNEAKLRAELYETDAELRSNEEEEKEDNKSGLSVNLISRNLSNIGISNANTLFNKSGCELDNENINSKLTASKQNVTNHPLTNSTNMKSACVNSYNDVNLCKQPNVVQFDAVPNSKSCVNSTNLISSNDRPFTSENFVSPLLPVNTVNPELSPISSYANSQSSSNNPKSMHGTC